jgi:PAS domain S-box-containing protein
LDRYRFLGFAFANADFLFEVDEAGRIAFALGAAQGLIGQSEQNLVGRSWKEIVAEGDWAVVEALFGGLETGRGGPITVTLGDQGQTRHVSLSACRLPPQTRISCAIAMGAPIPLSARTQVDDHGYQDRSDFETLAKTVLAAAATVGHDLDVALIELPGLGAALSLMGPRKASALLQRFAGALRAEAYGGAPPARLGEERFAVIRHRGRPPERIQHRLARAIAGADDDQSLSAQSQVLAIEPGLGALDRSLRALRFAVESFSHKGADGLASASLDEAFTRSVQQTLAEAGEFGRVIKARKFNLVFMPIVSLANGECRHFETLVRFEGDTSPYKLIRLAEELDLILELDLAIAEQTLSTIKALGRRAPALAVNVSGRSIMDPWYISELQRMRDAHGVDAGELILEITESAEIDDLAVADRHIQKLRRDGHVVCLDDFGAGSSSYSYLQRLHVDVIKIDGRYVTELAEDGRDAALVRHLVNLCGELGVATVAEMVGTPQVEEAARAAGVGFAQGFLYGPPTSEPKFTPRLKSNPERRGEPAHWA